MRFGFVGEQLGDESPEPDRFVCESGASGTGVEQIVPPGAVRGVDRVQHRGEASGEFVVAGDLERDRVLLDLRLGAHEALAHRRRCDEERSGDTGGVETEHRLQDESALHCRVDRRVRAGEHQLEPSVGNGGGRARHVVAILGRVVLGRVEALECWQRASGDVAASGGADDVAPCDADQPAVGSVGNSTRWPGS